MLVYSFSFSSLSIACKVESRRGTKGHKVKHTKDTRTNREVRGFGIWNVESSNSTKKPRDMRAIRIVKNRYQAVCMSPTQDLHLFPPTGNTYLRLDFLVPPIIQWDNICVGSHCYVLFIFPATVAMARDRWYEQTAMVRQVRASAAAAVFLCVSSRETSRKFLLCPLACASKRSCAYPATRDQLSARLPLLRADKIYVQAFYCNRLLTPLR